MNCERYLGDDARTITEETFLRMMDRAAYLGWADRVQILADGYRATVMLLTTLTMPDSDRMRFAMSAHTLFVQCVAAMIVFGERDGETPDPDAEFIAPRVYQCDDDQNATK